ncbi:MAG: sulfatase-like hydrolase/transferase [Anaerovoracaceae bacterium]|jgi:lipoteichoic acid synthase
MFDVKNKVNEYFYRFWGRYGILGIVTSVAIPVKLFLFYYLMGITANIVLVWLISCVLTYLLFASFKNKWVPATIYMLLTILMFADVTYNSFFNRYLSIGMLGAAGFVGDITDSIKEVLKPGFFALLLDGLLAFAALTYERVKGRGMVAVAKNSQPVYPIPTKGIKDTVSSFRSGLKRRFRPILAVLIILILMINATGSMLLASVSNQEFYSYHIKDVTTALLGSSVSAGSDIMHMAEGNYDLEKQGPLFGVAKDRNLIVIQLESFQNFVINAEYNGQEITPNLNKLLKENTIYFDNYYQQTGSGNTSDAEFATNNSIYGSLASYTYKLYEDNYFRGLPILLKEKGYETAAFHAYENREFWNRENAYKNQGFDVFYGGIDETKENQFQLAEWIGWGLSDGEFYKQTIDIIKKMKQPFYSFIISLSHHHPFEMPEQYQGLIELLPEDEGTFFGKYLNSAYYTDKALGEFIQYLKNEGLYEESVIAIYGDHLGLVKSDEDIAKAVGNFIGKPYDFDTMMNVPLVISVPGAEMDIKQTVSTAGGQLDFLPTMAYLMGFETLDTLHLGHNLLTIDSGLVAEQTYMTKGSFFTNEIAYEMSRDGVFQNGRAWNIKTGKPVNVDDCYGDFIKSMNIINASEYILKNDVLRQVYLEGQDVVNAFNNTTTGEYPDTIVVAGAPHEDLIGTNSLEALDASYEAGHRSIRVDVSWTSDSTAVLLSSWNELNKYFDTNKNEEISYEEFKELEMREGLHSMDYIDLMAWMKEHEDVTIIAKVQRSADYFMRCMEDYASEEFERLIVEVPGVQEYTGLYTSILSIEGCRVSPDQLLEYINRNKVPAVTMTSDSAEGIYKDILKEAGSINYIEEINRGIIGRSK